MNSQLIEKIIRTHYKTSPPIHYENPLIDREVARALAKSYTKILNLTDQRNLRYSILRSIRKICQLQPVDHVRVSENLIKLLIEFYIKVVEDFSKSDSTDKSLDEFLMRNITDLNLSPKYQYSVNPEVIQSLLNLNDSNALEFLTKNVLHLDNSNKNIILLKSLWNKSPDCINLDDISIKVKSEIEHTLLEICYKILVNKDLNFDLIQTESFNSLTKKCAKSSQCFHMCCNILNCLLIETDFNVNIQHVITLFINEVKLYCTETVSVLYPHHLGHVVLLMDIDINSLPDYLKTKYIQKVITSLRQIKIEFENDMIMLMSHFPNWFDVYLSLK